MRKTIYIVESSPDTNEHVLKSHPADNPADKAHVGLFWKRETADDICEYLNIADENLVFDQNQKPFPISKDEMDDLKYKNRTDRLLKLLTLDREAGRKPIPRQIVGTECFLVLQAIYGSMEQAIQAWMDSRSSAGESRKAH